MNWKKWAACLVLLAMVGVMILLVAEQAQAAKSTSGMDKELAGKRGVSDSLASPEKKDDDKSPSKLQMFLGVASIFVMIAVVKWV